jgi:hypothetical protein
MLSSTNGRHTAPPGLAFGEPDDRLSGVSSTPRLLGSITDVCGMLDRPVKPGDDEWGVAQLRRSHFLDPIFKQPILRPSLRAKRSNPWSLAKKEWIASSLRSSQ